ncbi:MAG: isoprenylcysteine carboxylmethyltransferase family protein [Verrucomicrobia bacterium]|nr:isoprenylcysteine carboxylmethyltransferase family protein [Verrucomicrobiota bacterium]
MFLLGAIVGIAGAVALGRHRTPFIEPRHDSLLVQHGIYRFIRHPLYASLILLCAGWSVLWQSAAGGIATGLLTLLLDAKARREEMRLRSKFPEYADYERRVKRLVPGIY